MKPNSNFNPFQQLLRILLPRLLINIIIFVLTKNGRQNCVTLTAGTTTQCLGYSRTVGGRRGLSYTIQRGSITMLRSSLIFVPAHDALNKLLIGPSVEMSGGPDVQINKGTNNCLKLHIKYKLIHLLVGGLTVWLS